ncbi:MAG: winged helix DNA-binding domain-containing protein, partial [Armatimonadetes bacterium]|nr:winged helix DNA-binding domain-containing protein [Armatimonadota bacterium]
WYVSTDALVLLERLRRGAWRPRTTLLSPFDTLINDRDRTELLFDFHFRLEIYVPKEKREYGYFVMPILHGDRLIGRIDPTMEHAHGRLIINAVYAEPDAPEGLAASRAVAGTVEELAAFLGARDIDYGRKVPSAWKRALHS